MINGTVSFAVKTASEQFKISPGLIAAVILQESGGNAKAVRYEPAFFRRYVEGTPREVASDAAVVQAYLGSESEA